LLIACTTCDVHLVQLGPKLQVQVLVLVHQHHLGKCAMEQRSSRTVVSHFDIVRFSGARSNGARYNGARCILTVRSVDVRELGNSLEDDVDELNVERRRQEEEQRRQLFLVLFVVLLHLSPRLVRQAIRDVLLHVVSQAFRKRHEVRTKNPRFLAEISNSPSLNNLRQARVRRDLRVLTVSASLEERLSLVLRRFVFFVCGACKDEGHCIVRMLRASLGSLGIFH